MLCILGWSMLGALFLAWLLAMFKAIGKEGLYIIGFLVGTLIYIFMAANLLTNCN